MLTRSLIVVGLAGLVVTGCQSRGQDDRAMAAYEAENGRLTAEVDRLDQQVQQLESTNLSLQEQLAMEREQTVGLSNQLRTVSNIDIAGMKLSPTGDSIILEQDFGFRTGSHALTDAGAAAIDQLATVLNSAEYADTLVRVEGHTYRMMTRQSFVRAIATVITGVCRPCVRHRSRRPWLHQGLIRCASLAPSVVSMNRALPARTKKLARPTAGLRFISAFERST